MSVQEPSSYERIGEMLHELQIPLSAAEAHGLLCGLLAGTTSAVAKRRWFTELLDAANLKPDGLAAHAEALKSLDNWWSATLSALNDTQFGFRLCLPDDDSPAADRAGALGEFCAGFGYGIGIALAGLNQPVLPDDTRELLADFQAIDSQCTCHCAADPAETEAALLELVEYVRVGVLLVHEELRPVMARTADDSARGVH